MLNRANDEHNQNYMGPARQVFKFFREDKKVLLIDAHCDTLSRVARNNESLRKNTGHFDLERAREAGLNVQFLAMFTRERDSERAWWDIQHQLGYYKEQEQFCTDLIYSVWSGDDLHRDNAEGKTGIILHLEGADALGGDLDNIDILYSQGVRSIGLTWNYGNALASGVMDPESGRGLTGTGRQAVKRLNTMGMLVDLAHISPEAFYQVLETSTSPPFVSHANVFSLCPHPRNLKDEQLKKIGELGGVIGISFVPIFLGSHPTIELLLDHICYVCELIGPQCVALGSDFDGCDNPVLPDVSHYPMLIKAMQSRGLSFAEISAICGGNLLRLLKEVI